VTLPHFIIERDEPLQAAVGDYVSVPVSQETFEHLRSLRLRPGEHAVLVDAPGHGLEIELAVVPGSAKGLLSGTVVRGLVDRVGPQLTLVQGISAADRMDQTIRQVTELGVVRIIPLMSERSTVRLDAASQAGKQQRWQRVARAAAEQSARLSVPEITAPLDLPQALRAVRGYDGLIAAWEEADAGDIGKAVRHVATTVFANPRVALFVGPEGGLSAAEINQLLNAEATVVSLGETILRTETAAVVASALVLYHLGALGAEDA
jgi:16S rRNA (uracil1498-N3)-methyltransferase